MNLGLVVRYKRIAVVTGLSAGLHPWIGRNYVSAWAYVDKSGRWLRWPYLRGGRNRLIGASRGLRGGRNRSIGGSRGCCNSTRRRSSTRSLSLLQRPSLGGCQLEMVGSMLCHS
jgi:hypothetical protein